MELTDTQRELLEFERRWPKYSNDKVRAVDEYFGFTYGEYERLLDAVLQVGAAREYDAVLVARLARQRRGEKWYLEKQHINRWS